MTDCPLSIWWIGIAHAKVKTVVKISVRKSKFGLWFFIHRHSVVDAPIDSKISWLFSITSLLSSGKIIWHFFVISTKQFFFDEMVKRIFFSLKYEHFLFSLISMLWEIWWMYVLFVGQKLAKLRFENSFHIFDSQVCIKFGIPGQSSGM